MDYGYRAGGALAAAAMLAAIAGCSPAGGNATAAAGAPAGGFAPSGGAAQPVSLPGGGSTTYVEPTQSAFSLTVPQGWSVKSGVQGPSPAQSKVWVQATSPDGATTISIGDPQIPNFTEPSQFHAAGTTAQAPGGGQSPVEAYENGVQFAADYAQRDWGQACQLQQTGSQPEPALVQIAQQRAAQFAAAVGTQAPPVRFDGGSATFTCQANGKALGVIDVTGELPSPMGGGSWSVSAIAAYSTTAANQAQTDQIARAMMASYAPNPQWQAQAAAETRQMLAQQQQQGQQQMAALTAQEGQESAMIRQQGIQDQARLTNEHNAFMQNFNAQGAARNAAWNQQMYNKETGQQAEMRYINNQTCIAWYDAAHTRCSATAQ
jgi:hypothetical protein